MTYKTLTVHLDTSACANARLALALKLARRFGAHLDGLCALFAPRPHEFYVMAGTADYYETHRKQRAEERGAIERLFHAELSRAQVEGSWTAADADPIATVTQRARTADLTIVGQADPDNPETYIADHFVETIVMGAGGPVLVMPYTGYVESIGERVLIAWNGSREAARAVHDAIPFITRAAHVTIAVTSTPLTPGPAEASCADLAAMLKRQGAAAVDIARIDLQSPVSTGDALLSYAADGGFDLLVMGAYGHARLQELVLGGATRTILLTMTLPVLMSH